jgi:excisionase family DNA binding protein
VSKRPVMDEPSLLIRMEEAAHLLSLSRSKVYAMAREGTLPGVVHVGDSIRVRRSVLEQWVATLRDER